MLHDTRTGELAPVVPARRGELRVYAAAPAGGRASLSDLRSLLLADLVRRVAQRQRLMVIAWQGGGVAAGAPGPGPASASPATPGTPPQGLIPANGGSSLGTAARDALRADCEALNIYPAEFPDTVPERFDVGVAPTARPRPGDQAYAPASDPAHAPPGDPSTAERQPRWVWTEPVLLDGDLAAEESAGPIATSLADRGIDPLALRFSLLAWHYRRPATLLPRLLVRTDGELRRWRERVADWATSPSKPMSPPYTAEIADAFDEDLDLPRALGAMRRLMDDASVAPGSKFESFAHLDQVLGLDLARKVGR